MATQERYTVPHYGPHIEGKKKEHFCAVRHLIGRFLCIRQRTRQDKCSVRETENEILTN